jgi:hypothetical protein
MFDLNRVRPLSSRPFVRRAFLFLVIGSLSACEFRQEKDRPVSSEIERLRGKVDYARVRKEVLAEFRCTKCHGQASHVSLQTYDEVIANLAGVESSVLLERSMPRSGPVPPGPSAVLRAWIDDGAPEFLAGAEPGPSDEPSATPSIAPVLPGYASIREKILAPKCLSCHVVGGEASNYPLDDYREVMDSIFEIVNLAEPEKSPLLLSVIRTDDKRMPPEPEAALSVAEIDVIRAWLRAGAPEK